MLERIRQVPAEVLDMPAYRRDFRVNWDTIEDVFWKLERIRSFREPGNDAWDAWVDGRWEDVLAILEARRPALMKEASDDESLGIESRRLRIVELPLTPYLQWELTALKVHAECGEGIRVLTPAGLGDLEANEPLPEVTILGAQVMYEVLYDDSGGLAGGRRITDPVVIRACRAEMAPLYAQAEDLLTLFEREVAHLPPPIPDHV